MLDKNSCAIILIVQIILIILMNGEPKMSKPQGKYAWTVKVGEKGQIVIPKEARHLFDINPGDTLIILGDEQQGIAIPPKNAFTKLIAAIFGDTMPLGEKGE